MKNTFMCLIVMQLQIYFNYESCKNNCFIADLKSNEIIFYCKCTFHFGIINKNEKKLITKGCKVFALTIDCHTKK